MDKSNTLERDKIHFAVMAIEAAAAQMRVCQNSTSCSNMLP